MSWFFVDESPIVDGGILFHEDKIKYLMDITIGANSEVTIYPSDYERDSIDIWVSV